MADKQRFDIHLLSRVLSMANPYRLLFAACITMAIVLAPIATIRPYIVKVMVDENIMNNDLDGLKWMVLLFVGLVLLHVIMQYFFIYSTAKLGQSVIKDLRVKIFKKMMNLRLRYFDQTPIGTSTTRTINDIEAINNVFAQGVITITADILAVFAVLGIMIYTSWRLTLVCLITLPFMIIASYIFKEKVKAAYQKVRNQISIMNAFLQERISGIRIVQIFGAERQEMQHFKKINKNYSQANLDSILYYAVFFPVVELISAITLGLMIWFGAKSFISDTVSFGALVAFPLYLNMLFRPVRMLADKFNTLQMGLVAADRVFNVIDNDATIPDHGIVEAESLEGKIKFENVHFAYDDENYVLKDISFQINPGETLAIVGSTGSGKSTIINILNRFYDIQKGSITIDDVDIKKYNIKNIRSHISIVLQDVFLFNGNVTDNITLMDDSISKEEVVNASKTIGAHAFMKKLPNGYDFQITERGGNLSVGQRQLISFVRALVFNPEILILDEATSSIDTETEAIIQYAIEKLIAKRTSIIIAHRLSTIRHADKILVLSAGRIVEYGTHDELLQKVEGHYKKLYDMQFADAV